MLEDFDSQRNEIIKQITAKGYEDEFREHFNRKKFSPFEQLGDAVFGECFLFKSLYEGVQNYQSYFLTMTHQAKKRFADEMIMQEVIDWNFYKSQKISE